ncbi:BamA/TamA family outer membrane protein [Niabella yanshanensis]|uniref:BamA/TamA family outer membrane protein n=1 Tax=Niabella yanshanensis TaxID=577386 RepID=A0ABZ0W5W9_9BACT|nr:BamA/TamA family outer membrane protein [Niabella yanshanensis]WQD37515.1 BamA/TamA family outer membrane protein [Niabella yanshanensis]
MRIFYNIITLTTIILGAASCTGLKALKEGQVLYTGATVKINPDSAKKVPGEKALKSTLEEMTRPEPNKKILGMRYKLSFYALAGEPKKPKGLRNWIRTKLGEPPVLMSDLRLQNNINILQSHLISKGYLQAAVTGEAIVKGRTGRAEYKAITNDRYTLNEIKFPTEPTALNNIIRRGADQSLLKSGIFYDIDVFTAERERIDNDLKEKGYFFFNPDFLLLQVDSTIGNNKANVYVKVKDMTPIEGLKPYRINEIKIYPNYNIRRDSALRLSKPVLHNDFKIYDPQNTYKPRIFDRLVFFQKDELYNRADHSLSLNRLVNLGTFRFVKAEFRPIDTLESDLLDANFYLTPQKKRSMSLQVTGTSKSNNFVGSEIKLSNTNRNLFRGAEQLVTSIAGGFETQVSGARTNSYSLSASARLIFPRIIAPINFKSASNFVPKTHITLGGQLLNRALYFTMLSGNAEFGYNWKGSQFVDHTFNPFSVTYVRTLKTTDSLEKLLVRVPSLRGNYENQFIFSTNYRFTYSDQFQDAKRNNIYFQGTAETAGNLVNAFLKKNDQGQKTLLNTAVNQFIKLEADFRDYYKIKPQLVLAGRANIGYGIPYGNSTVLPYIRQFFAGGSNDIRAFRARSLGPGSYNYDINPDSSQIFPDQGGDIKMMVNGELRAKLFSVIHGAVFVDAGNVWTAKADTSRMGSQFRLRNALNEFAVGGGVGLRVDASIFVIRFDLAMPFRKPWLPAGERWVFNQINFGDPTWRKQNLILNIGIGYPF